MKKGKELGAAIEEAIRLKLESGAAKSKAEIAKHFKVSAPSIYTWTSTGSISKDKLFEMFKYFSDVVPQTHWGLPDSESADLFTSAGQSDYGDYINVPLYQWPSWHNIDEIGKSKPDSFVLCPHKNAGKNTYALVMRDDSMLSPGEDGQLCQGDIIFIDPDETPHRDDYVMATSSKYQLASIKMLIEQDGRKCLLTSNPTWQEKYVLVDDTIGIHGVVIAKVRYFR